MWFLLNQAQVHNKLRLFASAVMGTVMPVKSSSFIVKEVNEMNEGIPDHDMKTNKPDTTWSIIELPGTFAKLSG